MAGDCSRLFFFLNILNSFFTFCSHVIYFGDQIFSDLADITLNYGWRTGAIIAELEKEIETLNSSEFREAVSALQALQQLVDEGHENNNLEKSVLNQLTQQRDALR